MTTPLLRTTAAVGLAGLAGLGWAALVEPRLFALRRFDVPVLPPDARPITVLQVSDLHMVPGQERKIAWIRALGELEPDLVIDTGDNLSHLRAVAPTLTALEPLLHRPGVFVMGSNDYYAPQPKNPALYLTADHARPLKRRVELPTDELAAGLAAHGWRDLDNRRTRMKVGGLDIELVGVDDPHIGRDHYPTRPEGSPSPDVTVGVAHAPYQRVLDTMTADGADLLVAGHTHGGQLRVPGYGALVTNCDLDRGRARGLSRWWVGAGSDPATPAPGNASWLHVSAGLGASRYAPVRFACRPEATLLTLLPRPDDRIGGSG